MPKGEPQLGRLGLGGMKNSGEVEMAELWVLKRSDGQRTLLNIARDRLCGSPHLASPPARW
jgi:aminopeptidase-like protein